MTKHIKDELEELLLKDGWERSEYDKIVMFRKRLKTNDEVGRFGSGRKVVTLEINETGRWLERYEGFDSVRLVDLRDFWGTTWCDAQGAIDEVLKKK